MKLYSLASYYKTRQKLENNEPTNASENYLLGHGTLGYITTQDIDKVVSLLLISGLETWANDYLAFIDSWARRTIKNPASWRFISTWHGHRAARCIPRLIEAREWFSHIAAANSDNEWGKRAAKVVALIDRRLES